MTANTEKIEFTFSKLVCTNLMARVCDVLRIVQCCQNETRDFVHAVLTFVRGNMGEIPEDLWCAIVNGTSVPEKYIINAVYPSLKRPVWEKIVPYMSVHPVHMDDLPPSAGVTRYVFIVPLSGNYPYRLDLRRRASRLSGRAADAVLDCGVPLELQRPACLMQQLMDRWGDDGEEAESFFQVGHPHWWFMASLNELFRFQNRRWDLKREVQPSVSKVWKLLSFIRLLGKYAKSEFCKTNAGERLKFAQCGLDTLESLQLLAARAYSFLQEEFRALVDMETSVECQRYLHALCHEIGTVLALHFFDDGDSFADAGLEESTRSLLLERKSAWLRWTSIVCLTVPHEWSFSAIVLGLRNWEAGLADKSWFHRTFVERVKLDKPHLRDIVKNDGSVFWKRNIIETLLGIRCPHHLNAKCMADAERFVKFLECAGIEIPEDPDKPLGDYPALEGQIHIIKSVVKINTLFPRSINEARFILGFIHYQRFLQTTAKIHAREGTVPGFEEYRSATMLDRITAMITDR